MKDGPTHVAWGQSKVEFQEEKGTINNEIWHKYTKARRILPQYQLRGRQEKCEEKFATKLFYKEFQ